MIHELLGGDVSVYDLGVLKLVDPIVFNSVDDKGITDLFGGIVQLEIAPQKFVDSLGVGADNRSGVIRGGQVDDRPCGRIKHLTMSRFVGSIGGQHYPEVEIAVDSFYWDSE